MLLLWTLAVHLQESYPVHHDSLEISIFFVCHSMSLCPLPFCSCVWQTSPRSFHPPDEDQLLSWWKIILCIKLLLLVGKEFSVVFWCFGLLFDLLGVFQKCCLSMEKGKDLVFCSSELLCVKPHKRDISAYSWLLYLLIKWTKIVYMLSPANITWLNLLWISYELQHVSEP